MLREFVINKNENNSINMTTKSQGIRKIFVKNRVLFLMLLPAVLYTIIFSYLPLGGLLIAFKNYNYADGILFSPWVGFANFKFLFVSGKFSLLVKNTIIYNFIFMSVNMTLQITMAILLAEMSGKYLKRIFQSFMFLPYFMSWVIVAAFAYNIFNYDYGALNTLLKSIGGKPVDIYSNPNMWYFLLPSFSAWKSVGYGCVLYLATIMGMDTECFESAQIDGANVFQRIWYITLPMLKPTVIIMILLEIGRILRGDFQMFYQLIGKASLLYEKTDVIDTFVFRSLTEMNDIGMTSAASFLQSVLCFAIIMAVNGLVRKYEKDSALF